MAEPVRAKSTIKLPGIALGAIVTVDPDIPYIASTLKAGLLIRVDEDGHEIKEKPPPVDTDPAPDLKPHEGPIEDEDETDAVVPPDMKDE